MNLINKTLNNEETINNEAILIEFLSTNPLILICDKNPQISFNPKRDVQSYFNDEKWILSNEENLDDMYVLNFYNYNKLNNTFLLEFKYLTIMSYFKNSQKYSSIKEIKRIASCLYPLMIASQSLGHQSFCDIGNELNFYSMMEKIKGQYSFRSLENILSTLKIANNITSTYFNLGINLSEQFNSIKNEFNSKSLAIKYSKTQSDYVEQTLYIPNKIHSKLISSCINFIDEKRVNLKNMMNLLEDDYILYEDIKKSYNITNVSDTKSQSKIFYKKTNITKEFFIKHNLTQFKSILEVQKEIRLLATSCVILILNFSGMRINEICNIKTDGFKVLNTEPKLYVLRSFETKISGGTTVDYITSPIVQDAVNILKDIHSLARKYDKNINLTDLFISSKHQKLVSYGTRNSLSMNIRDFSKEINLTIDDEDVKESELLNGPRENIIEGILWPLSSHQFRRTLIVNFVSHRLGTINSVKQQVKHMYATMTEYYAKNSQLANTFSLNVAKEISEGIEEELLNEGVRQYKSFYYSKDTLAGIKGQEIMNERENLKVLSDDEIKQLFKTGLYKISKSIYGYCTKGNLCDKKESVDPTFCGANCNTMIITKENAQNWQKLYFRNHKILNSEKDFSIGGIPMTGAKTTMISQNAIAQKIMDKFNLKY